MALGGKLWARAGDYYKSSPGSVWGSSARPHCPRLSVPPPRPLRPRPLLFSPELQPPLPPQQVS